MGHHRRRDLERDGIESLWIEVFRHNSRSILACILYRPPDTSRHLHKNFQEKLDEMIEISVNEYKETIVSRGCKLRLYEKQRAPRNQKHFHPEWFKANN